MDYLITPLMRLDYRYDYQLHFDSYFDGSNGETAFIEYSHDNGDDWDIFYTVPPSDDWVHFVLDLSPFSGNDYDPFMFAFHADDTGQDASGWAVDNVEIYSPEPPTTIQDYYVFLNDSLVVITDTNQAFIDGLIYGQSYEICVAARYPSGLSSKDCIEYTLTSTVERKNILDIMIYPNPTINHLNIESPENIQRIEINNLLGEIIFTEDYDQNTIRINLDYLSNGLYLLHFKTNQGIFSDKILILR